MKGRRPWACPGISASCCPRLCLPGACAGYLTQNGAQLLDPAGRLQAGIPLAPPEGDAGTGMAATNAVRPRTGNVSAGTSIFSMVVLERPLSRVYPQLDVVATPDGSPVAMVHCNNCTSDINAWAGVFGELAALAGQPLSTDALYTRLFSQTLHGEPDCGGMTVINYLSGEHVTGFERGCPLIVRNASARLTLPNLMRAQLYSALATLAIGMQSLREENVAIDMLIRPRRLFQKRRALVSNIWPMRLTRPVRCMMTAGRGRRIWYGPADGLHAAKGRSIKRCLIFWTTCLQTPRAQPSPPTLLPRGL